MAVQDDEVFVQIGHLLDHYPGWSLEASPTPGGSPMWCFVDWGDVVLSISVIDGRIVVYLPRTDQEMTLDSLNALGAWLSANQETFRPS